ncbi:MAG: HTH domain-containing protein [Clostridiales bacterium]|jgi:predicted DNA-binding transcriptional regulator YafY|nr:HTH domain-containing protein [Clostridiales bacterium]
MWAIMLDMLMDFMSNDILTARYFSEKHEKSTRTIQRYLDKMRDNKIPLVSVRGKGGGFYLSNAVDLTKMFFTDNEIDDIVASVKICLPEQNASRIENKMKTLKLQK